MNFEDQSKAECESGMDAALAIENERLEKEVARLIASAESSSEWHNDKLFEMTKYAKDIKAKLATAEKQVSDYKDNLFSLGQTLQHREDQLFAAADKFRDLQAMLATAREALRKLIESRHVEYSYEGCEKDDTGSCIHCGNVSYKPHSKTCEWELANQALAAIDGATAKEDR